MVYKLCRKFFVRLTIRVIPATRIKVQSKTGLFALASEFIRSGRSPTEVARLSPRGVAHLSEQVAQGICGHTRGAEMVGKQVRQRGALRDNVFSHCDPRSARVVIFGNFVIGHFVVIADEGGGHAIDCTLDAVAVTTMCHTLLNKTSPIERT